MDALVRGCRSGGVIAMVIAAGGCSTTRVAGVAEEPFPIEEYALPRSETNRRITEIITDLMPRLQAESEADRILAMKEIAAFVCRHIGPHAQQVEKLYAFADRQAGPRYTETMRWEHRDIGSSIRFLETLANAPEPDVQMFRTQLNAFLSRMRWHMDVEMNTVGAFVVDNELERQRRAERQGKPARGDGR